MRVWRNSVAVVIGLVGAFHRHIDVIGLVAAQLRELGPNPVQVKTSHHLIQMLGQHIHLLAVLTALGEQLDLGQDLIGERIAHHKTGMPRRTAQIDQTAFGQQDDPVAAGQGDVVDLGSPGSC